MDDIDRKKLIIIISMVMSLLIIIALVLWVFLGQKDTSDDDALSQQILYRMDNTGQDRDLAFEEGFEKVLLYIEEKKSTQIGRASCRERV